MEIDLARPLVWLITGGTGSLGTALAQRLLRLGHKVRALARNEHSHERLRLSIPREDRDRLSSFVGDVRDLARVMRASEGVDIVVHAAAMKVIPQCEYDPAECVATNIVGTLNVANAAIDRDVDRAILISSDKARAPSTHYGACKLTAERLWLASNRYLGTKGHKFICVVYGNVFGAQGSLLHAFRAQEREGCLQITDAKCTRFHITMSEAVDFILGAITNAEPGQLWIPKLPSYRVIDFAEALYSEMPTRIIGLRANEKIHELLVTEEESPYIQEHEDHYVMTPGLVQGQGGWDYHSGRNTWRMNVPQIRDAIKEFEDSQCTPS